VKYGDVLIMMLDLIYFIQLRKIEHVYQPMWNLGNSTLFGYEALVRFPDGVFADGIEEAFELAREIGLLYELDTMSISTAVRNFPFPLWSKEELLFLNIYPSTLLHNDFLLFIRQLISNFPQICGKIVFELNEAKDEESLWNIPKMKERISFLRENGFYIALDDMGKGAASLQKMIEFSPNYLKLDRYFSQDLFESNEKQHILSLLIEYSKDKMGLILEGIEEMKDFEQAKILQVPIAQGYLLGKPQKVTTANLSRSLKRHFVQQEAYLLKSNG
jgi:EAL domain-containing protein (putative c-di-GMP-specific phosphodiesterase class I)